MRYDVEKHLKDGWYLEVGKKHFKLRHDKYGLVTCSKTPSCPFVEMKIKSDIKRKMREYHAKTNTNT